MGRRIVIVGGVAGGMSAAARARRMDEHAEIVVLEKSGYISYANCGLPYFVAGRIAGKEKLLVTTPEKVAARFAIDARVNQEVVSIDRHSRVVKVKDLVGGEEYERGYDKLILAMGAIPILPKVDFLGAKNVFVLRSIEDAVRVDEAIRATRRGAKAVVVGAGFIGLEMVEALIDRGARVTLVERNATVLPPLDAEMSGPLAEVLAKHGVDVIAGSGIAQIRGEGGAGGQAREVVLDDGRSISAEMVLLSVGVRPNVALAMEAGIRMGTTGAIEVDEVGRTNDPDIYAVGDAVEVRHGVSGRATRIPLAGPANKQGRTAGEHAVTGRAAKVGKTLGTAIVSLFDVAAGLTGLSERAARDMGYDVDTAYATGAHHASYYPGAKAMRLKIVYDRETGLILGGQAVGAEGVDKRIDVIATVISLGGTVDDLANLDLAYAPQFGSAKDPVHQVAYVAQNQRRQIMDAVHPLEIKHRPLVDVRTEAEHAAGHLAGSINIPVEELRGRLAEVPDGAAVYCQIGQRGYVAQRILKQLGREDVVNVKGGYGLAAGLFLMKDR